MFGIWWQGKRKNYDMEKAYAFVKKVTKAANRAGRVTIESYGLENIPGENGFIFFPNHQGLFDVLVFLESCPVPFSFVIKKEASKVILLKQVIAALKSIVIDREDIRQSLEVINNITVWCIQPELVEFISICTLWIQPDILSFRLAELGTITLGD